jgi:cytochrome c biogenesis protein CcmG/thiol:disulfide interchange protein DsbE
MLPRLNFVFSFIFPLLLCVQLFAQEQEALSKAPQWQLFTEAGKQVNSSDFAGKPLIIHFWATWCPYCKKLQPGLDKLYKTYQSEGLQLIAVSFWEDEGATPQAELVARGLSFDTVVKGDDVARKGFAVKGTPTTVFIDKNGYIVASTRISDPEDPRLERMVKLLLEM